MNLADAPYIDYFLGELKEILPYFQVFPAMANQIFCLSTADKGLYHTIMSVSHFVADTRHNRSLVSAMQHHHKALDLLSRTHDIGEGLAISVSLLAWLGIIQCNRKDADVHLRGLHVIFQEIDKGIQGAFGHSALLMQILRFSIHLDTLASIIFAPRTPVFAAIPATEDNLSCDWIQQSTVGPQIAEWTVASFALDNLFHRASHVATKAYHLRKTRSPSTEAHISKSIRELRVEHAAWASRDLVRQVCDTEAQQNLSFLIPPSFLNYPPVRIVNKVYGNLMITWHAMDIFIDLIETPEIGPLNCRSRRFQSAVEICRHWSSLGRRGGMFSFGKLVALFLTGVAFGGEKRSPAEASWLNCWLSDGVADYFPVNRKASVCCYDYYADSRPLI